MQLHAGVFSQALKTAIIDFQLKKDHPDKLWLNIRRRWGDVAAWDQTLLEMVRIQDWLWSPMATSWWGCFYLVRELWAPHFPTGGHEGVGDGGRDWPVRQPAQTLCWDWSFQSLCMRNVCNVRSVVACNTCMGVGGLCSITSVPRLWPLFFQGLTILGGGQGIGAGVGF